MEVVLAVKRDPSVRPVLKEEMRFWSDGRGQENPTSADGIADRGDGRREMCLHLVQGVQPVKMLKKVVAHIPTASLFSSPHLPNPPTERLLLCSGPRVLQQHRQSLTRLGRWEWFVADSQQAYTKSDAPSPVKARDAAFDTPHARCEQAIARSPGPGAR